MRRILVFLIAGLLFSVGVATAPGAHAEPPQCNDAVDNDGDGLTDYPEDPGCSVREDVSEVDPPPECSDGVDNNGDGSVDYPDDPGCDSAEDTTEGPHPDPPCAFNGTNCDGMVLRYQGSTGRLLGAVGDREDCMAYRSILVKKKRDGRDRLMAHDQTDAVGEWQMKVPTRWRARFYSVAPKWTTIEADYGTETICQRRESRAVRLP